MAIEKRRGGYRVRWRTLDGRDRNRQCSTLKLAREIETQIRDARTRGFDWEPAPVRREPVTVEEVARAYLESRALRCRPSTVRMDGCHLDVFTRFIGERDPATKTPTVDVLSRALLDEFLAWLLRAEKGRHEKKRAPASAAKTARAVQLMWRWAEESERWPDVPRARTVELPRSAPAPVVAPTWAEMDACVLACRGWQRRLATWLRYTGLRAGESMLVEWRDVDLERSTLAIRPEIDKNGRGRIVPLHPLLVAEIETWKPDVGQPSGYLLPSGRRAKGPRAREPRGRDMARAWARAGVRAEVWRQRPDHAFRRGFKSGLLALGCHPDAVDHLQGHMLGAGSRGRYIDPWQALPLRDVIARVPPITAAPANVVELAGGVPHVSLARGPKQ